MTTKTKRRSSHFGFKCFIIIVMLVACAGLLEYVARRMMPKERKIARCIFRHRVMSAKRMVLRSMKTAIAEIWSLSTKIRQLSASSVWVAPQLTAPQFHVRNRHIRLY